MVLQGADRESEDGQPLDQGEGALQQGRQYSLFDKDGDRQESSAAPPGSPQEERAKALTTVDLRSLDIPRLCNKQRSLIKYFNPAYDRWLSLSLGMSIARAQIAAQRVLTATETAHYAEALVDANNHGILYRRALLWPTAIAILAYSRARGVARPAPGVTRLQTLLSIRRPTSQFLLAWFFSGMVETTVAAKTLENRMAHDYELSRLRVDMRSALRTSQDRAMSMQLPQRDFSESQKTAESNILSELARTPNRSDDGDIQDLARQRSAPSRPSRDLGQGPIRGPQTPDLDADDSFMSEQSYASEDATPIAETTSYDDQPVLGAWDRLRQRSASQQGETQQRATYGTNEQRQGSDRVTPQNTSAISAQRGDELSDNSAWTSDAGRAADSWERRRQAGSDAYDGARSTADGTRTSAESVSKSFAFSETEEERSWAKSEAQEEFDRRVEQERRGRDFDSR